MKILPSISLSLSISCVIVAPLRAIDFQTEIYPILSSKCMDCHSGPKAKSGLRMDSLEEFAKRIGGDDPVIIAGNAEKSLLAIKAGLPRSDGDAMPPPPARSRGAKPMTGMELARVKEWINQGAVIESTDPASARATTEWHDWTNFEGKTVKAAFVKTDGIRVMIRLEDGKEVSYQLNKLSPESQELARKLGAVN